MDPVVAALRGSLLFGTLEATHHEAFAKAARRKRYVRNEALWHAGDPVQEFTIVTAGLVKICAPVRSGQTIVGIFGPHESIGDSAVISGRTYPADAIAATETTDVIWISRATILDAMGHDAAVANAVNRSIVAHSLALQNKIRILAAGSVPRRLATLFLHLAERFGDDLADGDTMIPLVLSRADLACLVGTTVETTIRILSGWQKAGVIETSTEGFRIAELDPLERLAAVHDG